MARGTARAGALAAAITLTIVAAQGAARADAPLRAERTATGTPQVSTTGPGRVAPDAAALLAGVEGTPAVACELAVRTLGNRWGQGSVQPSVREPLGGSEQERALARWAWSGTPTTADGDALLDGLASPDACVRRLASSLLAEVADGGVRARIRERAERANGAERLAAIAALRGRRDAASVSTLVGLLRLDDAVVRSAAAWALGEIGAPDSVPALVRALRDPDVQVRVNAAWALGSIESPSATRPLVDLLASDSDARVRVAAAWALGKIE